MFHRIYIRLNEQLVTELFLGEAALVTDCGAFCMGQDVALIRSRDENQGYLVFLMRSPSVMGQLESLIVGSTFKRINVGQIKQFAVCRPPNDEQVEIAQYVANAHQQIQRLIDRIRDAVEHLVELRTALISAAVTGKIDVREEVARVASVV